jgi:hypothetical protein
MKNNRNRQVILKSRPADIRQADNFETIESDVPDLRDGQILVHNSYLSVEPAMRGWVSNVANYSDPVRIGEVMRSFAAGEVLKSAHPDFKPGDKVMGMFGWQEFAFVGPAAVTRKIREDGLPLSLSLGVAGLNGITAYFGLLDIGQPRPGDTVVVSTAARSDRRSVRSRNCPVAGRSGLPADRRRSRSAVSFSAMTWRSITRATIWSPRSPRPAQGVSTSISTTSVVPSATLSFAISPSALAW